MKFNKNFIFSIILISLFLITLSPVLAERTVDNDLRYGIIEPNGTLTTTNTSIADVDMIGFVCGDNTCTFTTDTLFSGDILNSGDDNFLLTFPTNLQNPNGYGVYQYKTGYIPFEIKTNLAGTDSDDPIPFTSYLTQQRTCTVPISNIDINENSGDVTISLEVNSPINHAGLLDLVPASIKDHYTVDVISSINITDSSNNQVYADTKVTNIDFSDSEQVSFDFNLSPGNYTLEIQTLSEDDKCLSSDVIINMETFEVPEIPDTTPPGQITNLALESKTNTTLKWTWNNPADSDFATAIVYIDGINIINTTDEMYLAQNLIPNSTHEISIVTIDTSGNINLNEVSREDITLPNLPSQDTTTPNGIENLQLESKTQTSLRWIWDNPITDFFQAIIFFDGINVQNTSNNFYEASNLIPNSTHLITIWTIDASGNINNTDVSSTGTTLINTTDTVPPGQITNLALESKTNTTLSWNWSAPSDSDFSHYLVSLDNAPYVSTNFNSFIALNLAPNSTHTIYVQTVDTSGNVNTTPVTNTATTLPNNIADPFSDLFIKIISPESKTYNVSEISLNITAEGTSTWYNINDIINITYNPLASISLNLPDGVYTLNAYTQNSFGNTNSTSVTFDVNTTIVPPIGTTAPNSITNLNATTITNTTILWTWVNPTNIDFSHAIVFLDGSNALNTSSTSFQAIGLVPNSTHTVIIWTSDFSGNINNTDVTNTATTLISSTSQNVTINDSGHTPEEDYDPANTDNSNSGGSGTTLKKSSSSGTTTGTLFIPLNPLQNTNIQINETSPLLLETEDIYTLKADIDTRLINFIIIIALIIICLLIILVYALRR